MYYRINKLSDDKELRVVYSRNFYLLEEVNDYFMYATDTREITCDVEVFPNVTILNWWFATPGKTYDIDLFTGTYNQLIHALGEEVFSPKTLDEIMNDLYAQIKITWDSAYNDDWDDAMDGFELLDEKIHGLAKKLGVELQEVEDKE